MSETCLDALACVAAVAFTCVSLERGLAEQAAIFALFAGAFLAETLRKLP